ncbi:MAG TPA: DUF4241 domain-containing protein [Kofleriaceae bacterium]|nr:DUF4241 domain-containing protein [Kofleriaceae bacterium]
MRGAQRSGALDLHTAFEASAIDDTIWTTTRHRVRRKPLGTLRLPSGRIVAADPFLAQPAFTTTVPPGAYPVELLLATYPDDEDGALEERIWLARIVFRREPPVAWALAVIPGQDVLTLGRGHELGYGVDSGTGCFADGGLFERITGDEAIHAGLNQQLDGPTRPAILRHGDGDADLIGFSCDDGTYPSWFGLDAGGAPVCLVTDFGDGDFPRPLANPEPGRVEAMIAARVDELLGHVRAGTTPAATDDPALGIDPLDRFCRELSRYEETGDHLERLLAGLVEAGSGAPRPFAAMISRVAFSEAGQPQLAAWLATASAEAIEALLRTRDRTQRPRLGPELALALRGLHAARRVPVGSLVRCAAWFCVGTEGPLAPILRAGLLDEHAGTRRGALRVLALMSRRVSLGPDVLEVMLAAVNDPEPTVQAKAAEAIVAAGVPPRVLKSFLDHPALAVRARIALHLGDDPPWMTGRKIARILREAALAGELNGWERRRAVELVGDPVLARQVEVLEARRRADNAAAWQRGEARSARDDDED